MHGLREFDNKIKSLKNTLKITSSMKMVSTVKLQKFTRIKQSAVAFSRIVDTITSDFNSVLCSLMAEIPINEKTSKRAIILFFTSDRGLCGRYNSNIFREVLKLSEKLKKNNIVPSFSCVGQKGYAYLLRYGIPLEQFFKSAAAHPDINSAIMISEDCVNRFLSGCTDEVYLVFTRKKSSMLEEPTIEKILPLEDNGKKYDQSCPIHESFILESTPEKSRQQVLEMKTLASVYRILIEATESEHASRMNAMYTASTNCDRMIQHYQQLRNRARQTAITTELSEIVTGKEALEG